MSMQEQVVLPQLVVTPFEATSNGAEAPQWVHLTPNGTFKGTDGRGPYTINDAFEVIASSMSAGKLVIDENHATDLGAKEGLPSPARGWIVAMEVRPDGIWGRVEWTRTGRDLVADQAYRGLSPVLSVNAGSGAVVSILRASLTNDPNLPVATLHARSAGPTTLTDVEKEQCAYYGVDQDDFANFKRRSAAANEGFGRSGVYEVKPSTLTEAELRMCRALGTDPDKFAKTKDAELAKVASAVNRELAYLKKAGISGP